MQGRWKLESVPASSSRKSRSLNKKDFKEYICYSFFFIHM